MELGPAKQPNEQQLPQLTQRKSSSTTLCDICFEPYDILGKWPMLACPNLHFFCDICIEGMFRYNANQPAPCPMCRALMRASLVKPHHELFHLLNKQNKIQNALKGQKNQLFLYAFSKQIFQVAAAYKSGQSETIAKLTKLDLSNKKIAILQHLQAFPSLIYLRLDKNMIEIPSEINSLKNLRFLNLSHNNIKDISPLQQLKKLRYLAVQFNQIEIIQSLLPFSLLSHWFLFGNPLKNIVAEEFLLIQFQNLLILSLSVAKSEAEKMNQVFLMGIQASYTFPKLYRLIVPEIASANLKSQIQKALQNRLTITWVPDLQKQSDMNEHDLWIGSLLSESFQYGQVFQFKVDIQSPYLSQYAIQSNKVTKLSNKFTILNSMHCLHKDGKVNFKLKINTPSQNVLIGLCNGYIKHNANVYSEHFAGLTFWGGVYVRGQYKALTGRLRLEDKPVIRMSVDFQQLRIQWFSDDIQVGNVQFPDQFKHSSLHFLVGMRDPDTTVLLLNE